jgi:DNA-binding HxlR family transcriptional regulator
MTRGRPQEHEVRVCDAALARAFGFLGKRWNGVLLGTLIAGPAGFSELRRAVAGISDSVPALQALTTWAAENLPPECGARPAGARVRAAAEPVRR